MSTALAAMGPPTALPNSPEAETGSAHLRLAEMVMAIWPARAVFAAAQLAIPDHLAHGALSTAQIANLTACHAPSLRRLLRALASCGILTETSPDRFGLTTLGHALQTDAPGSARALIMTIAGDWQWSAWGNFLHSLRTGQSGLLKSSGLDLFSFLAAHPQEQACFNEAMIGIHGATASAVAQNYDFNAFDSIVDVGGGTGTLLKTILKATRHPQGILFDLPETAMEARAAIANDGLAARCTVTDGDFFESVPDGGDCYILAHVLHDWTDAQATAILRNCRRAIPKGSRLLIIEAVLPEGDTRHHGKLMDLLMLAVTGGVERTEREFAALLSASGFKLERTIGTGTHQSIVEATPND
jgi:hypothetical protein